MHCTKMRLNKTYNGSVEIVLEIDGYYNKRKAEKLFQDLQDKEIHATLKEFKTNRSLEQNEMLWAVIKAISDKVNHSHREEDMMNIYRTLLERANIKREYIRTYKAAKNILEDNFRAVLEVPNSLKVENGKETVGFWVYYGSSKFNTKEMSELIEMALDMATEQGVDL